MRTQCECKCRDLKNQLRTAKLISISALIESFVRSLLIPVVGLKISQASLTYSRWNLKDPLEQNPRLRTKKCRNTSAEADKMARFVCAAIGLLSLPTTVLAGAQSNIVIYLNFRHGICFSLFQQQQRRRRRLGRRRTAATRPLSGPSSTRC